MGEPLGTGDIASLKEPSAAGASWVASSSGSCMGESLEHLTAVRKLREHLAADAGSITAQADLGCLDEELATVSDVSNFFLSDKLAAHSWTPPGAPPKGRGPIKYKELLRLHRGLVELGRKMQIYHYNDAQTQSTWLCVVRRGKSVLPLGVWATRWNAIACPDAAVVRDWVLELRDLIEDAWLKTKDAVHSQQSPLLAAPSSDRPRHGYRLQEPRWRASDSEHWRETYWSTDIGASTRTDWRTNDPSRWKGTTWNTDMTTSTSAGWRASGSERWRDTSWRTDTETDACADWRTSDSARWQGASDSARRQITCCNTNVAANEWAALPETACQRRTSKFRQYVVKATSLAASS